MSPGSFTGPLVPGSVAGHTEREVAQPAGVGLLSSVGQGVADHVRLHVGSFITHSTSP